MFDTELSYHDYLFTDSALQIGKIHCILLNASNKMAQKMNKTIMTKFGDIDVKDEELTDFGKDVGKSIPHWWVFSKEEYVETLLNRTKSVCASVKSIRAYPFLNTINDYDSYESIILDIRDFTKNNASEINNIYEYVSWLQEKSNLAPSILFTRDVWRSSISYYENPKIDTDLVDEISIEDCVEIALGLKNENRYAFVNTYNKINLQVYPDDSEVPCDLPINCKPVIIHTSREIIRIISDYFKYICNSLELIIAEIEEYNETSVILPPQNIYISERSKDNIKIATAQINFELSEGFPPQIVDQQVTKEKINKAIELSIQYEADIICLPELSVCESWISELQKQCGDKIIITGVNYDQQQHNVCKLISNTDKLILHPFKIMPSDFEQGDDVQPRMKSGKKIFNYHTKYGNFAILICRDFLNYRQHFNKDVDILFVPSFNKATERFHGEANSHVQNYDSYVVISNTAIYGGTSIFGTIKNTDFDLLVDRGCKEKNDASYKLCELKKGEEGIIIADFSLVYKSHQVPTPIDPESSIKPVTNVRKITF